MFPINLPIDGPKEKKKRKKKKHTPANMPISVHDLTEEDWNAIRLLFPGALESKDVAYVLQVAEQYISLYK